MADILDISPYVFIQKGHPYIRVKVTANARHDQLIINPDDDAPLHVKVVVIAENGKANKSVIKLLSKKTGRPKSDFQLVHGELNRFKTFRLPY